MKRYLFISIFCAIILCMGRTALAQDQGFGIGAMINSPTGISMKGWVSEDLAVDGAVSFGVGQNFSQFYLHSDVIYHSSSMNDELELEYGTLRYYYGAGMRVLWSDLTNDVTTGLRAPLGTTYTFGDSSVESFFELAPTIDFTPGFRFHFAGAFGMRVYLN